MAETGAEGRQEARTHVPLDTKTRRYHLNRFLDYDGAAHDHPCVCCPYGPVQVRVPQVHPPQTTFATLPPKDTLGKRIHVFEAHQSLAVNLSRVSGSPNGDD